MQQNGMRNREIYNQNQRFYYFFLIIDKRRENVSDNMEDLSNIIKFFVFNLDFQRQILRYGFMCK